MQSIPPTAFFKDKKYQKGRNGGAVSSNTNIPLDVLKDSLDMNQYQAVVSHYSRLVTIHS